MPAYTKLRVAELRELCEEPGIEYEGLNRAALLDALRQDDQRAEEETNDDEEEEMMGVTWKKDRMMKGRKSSWATICLVMPPVS